MKIFIDKINNNRKVFREKSIASIRLSLSKAYYSAINYLPEKLLKDHVKAFWWSGYYNFGDLITPALLRFVSLAPVLTPPQKAELAATGSILGLLPPNFSGAIIGSGLLSNRNDLRFPDANVLAVRGELTRNRIAAPHNTVLGDTGLLLPDLLKKRQNKQFVLGIIPHYVDMNHYIIIEMKRNLKNESVKFINVLQQPMEVCKEIDQCEYVMSSSLHGCIVADSLLIPNCWVVISNLLYGKNFKFHDYYSSLNIERLPLYLKGNESMLDIVSKAQRPPSSIVEIKNNLRKCFYNYIDTFNL